MEKKNPATRGSERGEAPSGYASEGGRRKPPKMTARFLIFIIVLSLPALMAACGSLIPFDAAQESSDSPESDDADNSSSPGIEQDVSGRLVLALGGIAQGTDTIQTEEDLTGKSLDFETEDKDLIEFTMIEGFNSFWAGKGARVLPF